MNIIEKTKSIIQDFPQIKDVCDNINIDFTADNVDSYGLNSLGDFLVSKSITGNEIRNHAFVLFAKYSSFNDYQRLSNSGLLLNLQRYLERIYNEEFDDNGENCEITSIRCSNAQLFELPSESLVKEVIYQIQILVNYKIYKWKELKIWLKN